MSAGQFIVLVGFVVVWALFAQTEVAQRADMPGPIATAVALQELATSSEYWLAILTTLESWVMALLLALVVGVPVGLFIGRNHFAADASKGTIDFLRTIPAVAFVPLFLPVLGRSLS